MNLLGAVAGGRLYTSPPGLPLEPPLHKYRLASRPRWTQWAAIWD